MSDSNTIFSLRSVPGVRASAISAGLYDEERNDIAVIELAKNTMCAAVFTKNSFPAAPIEVAKQHLLSMAPRYCLINAANANAGTGSQGIADCLKTCQALADYADCKVESILPFSTGVIGEPFAVDKICGCLPELLAALKNNAWNAVSRAIMTTDTVAKTVSRQVVLGGELVTFTGFAKGSGMIHPNMGTMLAFIVCDAVVCDAILQDVLSAAVAESFNRICVDGDSSTNDACVLFASGRAKHSPITSMRNPNGLMFAKMINEICMELALAIVKDGEGASKLVCLSVTGGNSIAEVERVARAVATSSLVKTALYAADPNWGRILAATGSVGLPLSYLDKLSISIGDECVFSNGQLAANYSEEHARAIMSEQEYTITIDFAVGAAHTTVWFCDLSPEYVHINASYRS